MTFRIVITVVSLLLLSVISISSVSAHHSYILTVQQSRAGLTNGESATGFIPSRSDIEIKDIQARIETR